MKKIMLVMSVLLFSSSMMSISYAETVDVCMEKIETQNNLPKGTFKAMMFLEKGTTSIEKAKKVRTKEKLYGPIGLDDRAVKFIAKKSGVSEEKIKNDDCANFAAVAFLMNRKGKDQPLSVKFENYHGRNIPIYNERANYLITENNKNERSKNDL